ncbi:MAG: heat-shock protein Hsp20 [Desulfobulbus propionicus]|nr:MAG: heat-shock protein Hsp20 [Desulfobulbus propionicus]
MWTRMNELERMMNNMDLFRNRLGGLFHEFERIPSPRYHLAGVSTYPRTNFTDTGDNLKVTFEVPGVTKENLSITINGKNLEVSGKREHKVPEGYKALRTEREAQSFTRSFTLPYEVDVDKVHAVLKDGILGLTLPKSEAVKPKHITIN